jgi:hypothetical protein
VGQPTVGSNPTPSALSRVADIVNGRRATILAMPRTARTIAVACTAAAALLFLTIPAFAHSDQGAITTEARPGPASLTVMARARVVFANDGHPANEATVTVAASGPGGAQIGPTALNRVEDGEYEAVVALPAAGDWSFQFTSTNPTASTSATSTLALPPTQAPLTRQADRGSPDRDDDSTGLNASVFAVAGGAVAVAAVVVGGVFVVRRRR